MPQENDGPLSIGEMFENIIGPLNLIESAIGWAAKHTTVPKSWASKGK